MLDEQLYEQCLGAAARALHRGLVAGSMDLFETADLFYKIYSEKLDKEAQGDAALSYNDSIVSIEEVGEVETVDISVTGDNLFFCNDILTKNSMGLVHSLDAFIALIATEELEAMNQVLIKVLKNRWGENGGKFMLGVDRPKMRFYDLDGEVEVEREEVVTTAMRNQRERPSKQLK